MSDIFPHQWKRGYIIKYNLDKIDDRVEWQKQLDFVKQCGQRQDSLNEQLQDLRIVANKFGFYDAADFIRTTLEK